MIYRKRLWTLGLSAALMLSLAGCRPQAVQSDEPADPGQVRLQRIGSAYAQAINQLKHGPRSLEELTPFLRREPDGEPLIAAIAGKEVIVIWGLDFRDLTARPRPDAPPQAPVLAYESASKDGMRYVLQTATQVQEMSDEDFRAAYFPKGHKPQ
ncbi:hypothetical protein AYO40_04270 [Planctomycetaceae bacterium SCGC AG-212-D15]|nr:hypothetical protein AYO40_04270 [Planctomycetaceae bacterium SCGC AG-212-D15]